MDYDEICYECTGLGDDYFINDKGELECACDDCWVSRAIREDDET